MTVLVLVVASCSIGDEDRCTEGFVFDDALGICRPTQTDMGAPADQGPSVDQASAADQGPVSDGVAAPEISIDAAAGAQFGEPCVEQTDCVTEADYCTYNDFTKSGVCTYKDCTADSCPTGWQCCDCSAVGWPIFCGPDNEAQLEAVCSCMTKSN
jgi:hypothetical protein